MENSFYFLDGSECSRVWNNALHAHYPSTCNQQITLHQKCFPHKHILYALDITLHTLLVNTSTLAHHSTNAYRYIHAYTYPYIHTHTYTHLCTHTRAPPCGNRVVGCKAAELLLVSFFFFFLCDFFYYFLKFFWFFSFSDFSCASM